jgi:hypothetical protein
MFCEFLKRIIDLVLWTLLDDDALHSAGDHDRRVDYTRNWVKRKRCHTFFASTIYNLTGQIGSIFCATLSKPMNCVHDDKIR